MCHPDSWWYCFYGAERQYSCDRKGDTGFVGRTGLLPVSIIILVDFGQSSLLDHGGDGAMDGGEDAGGSEKSVALGGLSMLCCKFYVVMGFGYRY